MQNQHSAINQLILESKDLSMFPITRVVTESGKYWRVVNNQTGTVCDYRTKFAAQTAICSVVRRMMGE